MKAYLQKKKKQGFTLVELMIVVAIIGILSAIAIPNFQKYQAKARTSEAKIKLSAIYTAEQSFYSEWAGYTSCLNVAGYGVDSASTHFYTTGFSNAATTQGGVAVNGSPSCSEGTANIKCYAANASGTGTATSCAGMGATYNVTTTTFVAGAISNLLSGAGTDTWQINNSRVIQQTTVGY